MSRGIDKEILANQSSRGGLPKRVLITAGGTGGHIFPALAVANELQGLGFEIHWIGSRGGLEEKLVSPHYPLKLLDIKGLRGKGLLGLLLAPWRLLRSTWQAWRLMAEIRPQLVLGMGGFVTGPTGVAAKLRSIPLIIHEQNSIAGYTNRLLAYLAKYTLQAFPGAFSVKIKAITVGNPVRQAIINMADPLQRLADRVGPIRLLVVGGSLGAQFFNETVIEVLKMMPAAERPQLWQQTGKDKAEALSAQYASCQIDAKVTPFIDDMPAALSWADLILARSGALTVAEIAAAGIASILVPYPHAVDNHQFYNACYLEQADAARIMLQENFDKQQFVNFLQECRQHREVLQRMASAARQLSWPQATAEVAKYCIAALNN